MNNIRGTAQALVVALLLTGPAFASSPEFLVGGAAPAPAANERYAPAAASDGQDYFVVWSDDRASMGSVIGTRVTREGRILDPLGILISAGMGRADEPQVVWDGDAYLVVWGAAERDLSNAGIFAARVAPDGTMAMQPRRIVDDAYTYRGRYLASNGTVSVIAYALDNVEIVVLDRQGNTTHRETIQSNNPREPAVAAGTSRFVVTWSTNQGYTIADDVVTAVALTASGRVTGDPVTVGHGEHPAVASDGTRFTIAYEENQEWQQYILHSRTLNRDLEPVGAEHSLLTNRQIEDAQVLWLGSHYEVTAVQRVVAGEDEIVSIRVDSNGNPQQPVRQRGNKLYYTYWQRVSSATNGSDVLIVRTAYGTPDVGLQIYAQLHPGNATSAPGGPMLLSWSGNAHREPVIAAGPSGYAAAWIENGGTYITRLDENGNSRDGRGIRLSGFFYGAVRVAFDGTNYVVAWRDHAFIGVRYIAPSNGATVAELHVPVAEWVHLALATSPDATYLAYVDTQVRVVRIPTATHTADPVPLAVSPEDMSVDHPALAWNGSELLVTWTEEYLYPRGDPPLVVSINVYGARVTAGLTLLDPAPLRIAQTPEEETDSFDPPSVASNGRDWLVVTSRNSANVLARRVLASGTLEEPETIGAGFAPAVAWDGMRYAVTWKEGPFSYDQLAHPLVLASVPGLGTPVATGRVAVARVPVTSLPAIAGAGNGRSAVIYTRASFLPQHAGVQRSFFRVMDFTAPRGRAVRR